MNNLKSRFATGVVSGILMFTGISAQAAAPLIFPLDIKFETNKADLYPSAATDKEFKQLMSQLNQYPNAKVEIQGYADSTGPEALNKTLSKQRAEAVRQRFIQKEGVAPDRVIAIGYGEEKSPLSNTTDIGRSQNRHVVARIVKVEEGVTQAPGVHQNQ